jgi:hypothetical protein
MTLDHFKKLVDESAELGAETVGLFGYGEPLLDRTIIEKTNYVRMKGLEPILTTNASLLSNAMTHGLLNAGLKQIRFSVHGIGPTYDETHLGLSWFKTITNIYNFIGMNQGQCVTHVSVIPMHGERIEDIKNLWLPIVDYLEIWRPHSWAGLKDYRKPVAKKATCGRPLSGPVQIMADGKMIVCCFDVNGEMVIGDTHKNTIKEILNGEALARVIHCHASGDMTGLLCSKCDQLNCYTDEDYPLLYSNRDESRQLNVTSSTKFNLMGERNGTHIH